MNTLITSVPSSAKPAIAPYNDDNCVLSFCKALLNSLVIRVCRLFVDAKIEKRYLYQFHADLRLIFKILTVEILRNGGH